MANAALVLIICVAAFGFLAWTYLKRTSAGESTSNVFTPKQPVINGPAFIWPALGEYEFEVVGEGFSQDALRSLAGDHGDQSPYLLTTAMVIPYESNPHDNKAVRVEISGLIVGHLSRDDARSFRRRLGAKKIGATATQCDALIVGGYKMLDGSRAHYGVKLDMKPFD